MSMSVYARQQLVDFQEVGLGSAASTLIFLIIATILAYLAYRNIWASVKDRKVRITGPLEPENIARSDAAKRDQGIAG